MINGTFTGYECPAGWQMYNHSCYLLGEESTNYHEASSECFMNMATLVSVADQAEHEFIMIWLRRGKYCSPAGNEGNLVFF